MVNKKITRKEYINILQTMSIGNTERKAIEYAIKQIKQVKKWKRKAKKNDKHANQGSYDDVVSRRALIDVLSDEFHDDLVANILSKLPSVKLQPCDDVISRRAVIDKVIDAVDEWDGGCNKSRATLIEKAIRDLPPVRPQEPTDDKCHYCEHNFTPYKGNTGEFTEQEPTSVKHDTFPVRLQINKVSKHISNIDLDEFEQEPKTGHYEKHIDHTDCIWYGSNSSCPVTCSQYRDGWNDAMDYIFKNGKGYQPYRHDG